MPHTFKSSWKSLLINYEPMSYSLRQSPILMPTGRITGLYDIMSSGKYQKGPEIWIISAFAFTQDYRFHLPRLQTHSWGGTRTFWVWSAIYGHYNQQQSEIILKKKKNSIYSYQFIWVFICITNTILFMILWNE